MMQMAEKLAHLTQEHTWLIDVNPRVISIVGPTASGKTGLGIALAKHLHSSGQDAEIINADAYQMYRGMDIGTAKASPEEQASVQHHLIDIIESSEEMSAARFQSLARGVVAELSRQNIRPLLVGGSGLYARAALDSMEFQGTDPALRTRLEDRAKTEGGGALFAELERLDPKAAATMEPHNVRRTIRALEVIEMTGRPYSASLPRYEYVVPALQIGLDVNRDDLDQRIDTRTQQMRESGFVDEVATLRSQLSVTAERALGYAQIIDALDGVTTEDEAFALIAQKTKRLARKQMGWFGRDARIHWLDATAPDLLDQAVELVARADAGDFDATDFGEVSPVTHHLGTVG